MPFPSFAHLGDFATVFNVSHTPIKADELKTKLTKYKLLSTIPRMAG
jgi:hypothetical protein